MRRHLGTVVKLVGFGLLLLLLASRLDLASVQQAFHGTALQIVMAAVLFSAAMVFRVAKWVVQARATGFEFQTVRLVHGFLWGILLGLVTPLRAGELYRLGALRKGGAPLRGADLGLGAAALVLEKAYEVLTLTTLVGLGALMVFPSPLIGLGLLGGVGIAGIVGVANLPIPKMPGPLQGIAEKLVAARDALSMRQRWIILGCTAAANVLNLFGAGFVYQMFGELPWSILLFGLPAVAFSSAVPITVSGIGLREVAAMEVFGRAGYPESAAAVAATLVFLGTNVFPALVALPMEPWVGRTPSP